MTLGIASTQESDCIPCPRGNYCVFNDYFRYLVYDATMTNTSLTALIAAVEINPLYTGKCDASFICLPGSTTKIPNDGIQGYQCPKGAYCSSG